MSNLVIREFQMKDYDALIALWEDAKLPSRPLGRDGRDDIERQLKEPTAIYLVAEMDGELVGAVLGTHDGRKGWINRLAVSPAHQKQGIARRLVEELEKRIYGLGIWIIACLIEDWNEESSQVFESLGYKAHPDIKYLSKRKDPKI